MWAEKAKQLKLETQEALRLIFNELNNGQRQKLASNEKVKPLLERYEISIDY